MKPLSIILFACILFSCAKKPSNNNSTNAVTSTITNTKAYVQFAISTTTGGISHTSYYSLNGNKTYYNSVTFRKACSTCIISSDTFTVKTGDNIQAFLLDSNYQVPDEITIRVYKLVNGTYNWVDGSDVFGASTNCAYNF